MRRFVLFARCWWLLPQVANGLALAFPDDGAPTMVAQQRVFTSPDGPNHSAIVLEID